MTTTTNEREPFVDPGRLTNGEAVVHSSLQARVDALAASVGAPKQHNLSPGYDPDLFLEALKQRHDALAMITDKLTARHAEQEQRQRELDVREKQVAFREKRIAAHERLADKKSWEALVNAPDTKDIYAAWEALDNAIRTAMGSMPDEILWYFVDKAEGNMLVQEAAEQVLHRRAEKS